MIRLNQLFVWSIISISIYGCRMYDPIRYGGVPTQHDYKHFAQRKIMNQGPRFDFYYSDFNYQLGSKIGLTNKDLNSTNVSLDDFVLLHKTISFLIIRNDTIIYQFYDKKYSDTSLVSTFSVAKPFVSTLIGIAIDEKKIHSIDDYIVDYLPMFKSKPGFDKIKIKHLLHHTSGIKFTDNPSNPMSDNAAFYWGTNLRNLMQNAQIEQNPDKKFKYSSENTMLLSFILETVTGAPLSKYLEDKIWKPLGMSGPAYWSLDRNDNQAIEKSFCCLQARTIDLAKFARLYLNEGNWQGKQIISKEWVDYSTHPDPTGNNKHFYNNNWGIGPLKYASYFAIGLYGQFLYIYPADNLIMIRFGDNDVFYHPNYWMNVFIQIIDQLDQS